MGCSDAAGRRAPRELLSLFARVHQMDVEKLLAQLREVGSDSGTVPMNHPNNGGQPPAEGEEGRPLIKENTRQSRTHPTQSGSRVSQKLVGVRRAAYRFAARYPR